MYRNCKRKIENFGKTGLSQKAQKFVKYSDNRPIAPLFGRYFNILP